MLGENGPIKLQPTDRDLAISADGTLSVRDGAGAAVDSQRGKLRLVSFDNPGLLEKEGSSTLAAPSARTHQSRSKSSSSQWSTSSETAGFSRTLASRRKARVRFGFASTVL